MLPGSSRAFGPPRRWRRAADLSSAQARVTALGLPRVKLAEPRWAGPPKTAWLGLPLPSPLPSAFVIEARDARLLAPDGNLVLADDTWVIDCGFAPWTDADNLFRYHKLALRKKSRPLRRLPGRTLSLVGDFTGFSYGHWLLDSITRWSLVEAAGLGAADFDRVYIPSPGACARELAARLPVPAEKLVLDLFTDDVLCDELVATSHPGWPGFVPAFASDLLRRIGPAPATPSNDRVAIVRDGFRRNLVNREEIYAILRNRGFDLLDPRHDRDIASRCAGASLLFSIEGSQAYDLLFAPRGAKALIVASPHHDTFPYPHSAAGSAGVELSLVAGVPVSGEESDFYLPPDLLVGVLDGWGATHAR